MKSLGALATHYAAEVQTTALLLKITRQDATVLGFTSHDVDVTYSGVTYSRNGFTPTATRATANLAVDNLEGQILIDDATITDADILGGKYDYATIQIYRINVADTSVAETLFSGRIGQVSVVRGVATAEARSKSQALQQTIVRLYQPACDADLGDARCGVSLAGITVTGTVTSVSSQRMFTDTGRTEATNYFRYGKLTFTSGANSGFAREVYSSTSGGAIVLAMAMPYTIAVGDTYSVYPGCDKSTTVCSGTFSNIVNFRGFPDVIGIDKMIRPGGM